MDAAADNVDMIPDQGLSHEWKRIEILSQCLLDSRSAKNISEAQLKQLEYQQQQVTLLRGSQGCWDKLPVHNLPSLALDLLAAVYAPTVNPSVALLFQDLQQSSRSSPTLAFLYRLLALSEADYQLAQQLTDQQGELLSRGLIMVQGEGPMMQLTPHTAVMQVITGRRALLQIPGAVRIVSDVNWQDLIIPAAQLRMLQEFLMWIAHREQVENEWAGRSAGGPIALFCGPSGTGKTFAASVLANALGWSLFRVDLGALISKYIGETEKNLNALFDAAQGQKLLLQFDEVDALMGKRGEIKDARDRYANMEVSHLLSRIEQHQGPCILTTNLSKQIDLAFQRRFHFVVTFARPGVKERLALWKALLPVKAPLDDDLDLPLTAEAVALSGGEIRNAAMHAAILAADEQKNVAMRHISVGVWRVLQKSEGKTRVNELRQLALYLPPGIIGSD
ncbi:MAG: AAA+ superfamily predicted ATPase [Psychromonas sp.]|jgi:AAA+ superfamily predicted ATPase|uniref:ATP-binding protein n=1 Tax=Psychromonas sp. TaxID=1884585 RepID=UPI0039E68FA2